MSVETDIAELKKDVKYIKDIFADKCVEMQKHLDESNPVRIEVHDNTKFRTNLTKAMWVVYAAVAGLFLKVFFFK